MEELAETWKVIPDTDYSVSSFGRVASRKYGRWTPLKPGKERGGYQKVELCHRSVYCTRKVHHLVALAFVGPRPSPQHEINHRDGNKSNNRADNLEWVTSSENKRHRYDILRHGAARGERHGHVKLREDQVKDIRARLAAGQLGTRLAAEYGIRPQSVQSIKWGRSWGWLV